MIPDWNKSLVAKNPYLRLLAQVNLLLTEVSPFISAWELD